MRRCPVCRSRIGWPKDLEPDPAASSWESFELDSHVQSPRCAQCEWPIRGHGVLREGVFYCCAHDPQWLESAG